MFDTSVEQWRCHGCQKSFQDGIALAKHTDTVMSRSQSAQGRMHKLMIEWQRLISEWQSLMLEWTEVLAHSESESAPAENGRERQGNAKPLSCPDSDCMGTKQRYTSLRSLQRHYRAHVPFKGRCHYCECEFEMTISEYDRHLDKCSKNRRSSSKVKALAQAQKKRIHKIACDKLRLMMPSEAINVPVDHGRFEYIMAGETTGGINSLTASSNDQLHLSLDNQLRSLPNVMNPSTFRYFRGTAFSGEKTPVDWALENPGLSVASPITAPNDLHQLPLSGSDHFGMITNSDSLPYSRGTAFGGKKTPVDWALHDFDTIGPNAESVGVYPGNSTHIGEILEAEMG